MDSRAHEVIIKITVLILLLISCAELIAHETWKVWNEYHAWHSAMEQLKR